MFLNMIGSLDNGVDLRAPFAGLFVLAPRPALAIMLMAGAIAVRSMASRSGGRPIEPLMVAFALASIFSFAATLKIGAGGNYYLEAFVFACLVAARELGLGAAKWAAGNSSRAAGAGVLLALALLGASEIRDGRLAISAIKEVRLAWKEAPISEEVRMIPGAILAPSPFIALAKPSPPTIMDVFQWSVLVKRGRLSPQPLYDRMASGEILGVVIPTAELSVENPLYPDGYYQHLREWYGTGAYSPTLALMIHKKALR